MGTHPSDRTTGSQYPQEAGRARSQHKGSPEIRATPWHCQPAQHDLLRSLSAAQTHLRSTMAKILIYPSSLAEGAPMALVLGQQQANRPQQLMVLPALFVKREIFREMFLETHLHPLSTTTKPMCLAPSTATKAPQDTLTTATGRTHTSPGQRPQSHHSPSITLQ